MKSSNGRSLAFLPIVLRSSGKRGVVVASFAEVS